jgi:hypothetical protein
MCSNRYTHTLGTHTHTLGTHTHTHTLGTRTHTQAWNTHTHINTYQHTHAPGSHAQAHAARRRRASLCLPVLLVPQPPPTESVWVHHRLQYKDMWCITIDTMSNNRAASICMHAQYAPTHTHTRARAALCVLLHVQHVCIPLIAGRAAGTLARVSSSAPIIHRTCGWRAHSSGMTSASMSIPFLYTSRLSATIVTSLEFARPRTP